jgi:O-antigen chain-terminating methyltransferase
MIKPPDTEIDVDEIMRRIRKEAERRKKLPEQETYQEAEPLTSKSSTIEPVPDQLDIHVLPYYINYHGFLVQAKEKEGLKGRIKSFLFKFIRFFAWWQEQINRALYQELMAQKARMDERDRRVQELLNQQMNSLKNELSERDKMIEDLNNRLVHLSQAKDELSRELGDQRVKIGETESHLKGLLHQQGDQLRGELVERDKILEDLRNRLNLFGQAKDELSRELGDQRVKIGETESHLEGLLHQQGDQLRGELAERDKVLEDLTNRFSFFGQAKDELSRELSDQKNKINATEKWMESLVNQRIDGIKSELAERDKVVESLNNRLVQFGRVEEGLNQGLTIQKEKLDEIEKVAQNLLNQGIDNLRLEFTETHKDLNAAVESVKKELSGLLEVKSAISQMTKEMSDHKLNILDQQRSLALLLEEARKRLPGPIGPKQIKNMLKEEDHLLDGMYVNFEDRFRGTREDIKERLKVYLPHVEQAKKGKRSFSILDLGCGRGEWLELLRENGYIARGVDFNRVMVRQCQAVGLDVIESDMIEYLRNQKPNTFGAITGFHIVEHLAFKTLISLFDETFRVLQSGGMVIFETPNPENLIVAACNFYFDPTHRSPLPPRLLNFLMESRGFAKTEIIRLHPFGFFREEQKTSTAVEALIPLFNTEQDYSVIAYKE